MVDRPPAAPEVKDGTVLAVFRDIIGFQLSVRTEAEREFLLTIVADQLVHATERLIEAASDPELQNEAQWLIDAYRYMRGECATSL